jgi:hypothetical protein
LADPFGPLDNLVHPSIEPDAVKEDQNSGGDKQPADYFKEDLLKELAESDAGDKQGQSRAPERQKGPFIGHDSALNGHEIPELGLF